MKQGSLRIIAPAVALIGLTALAGCDENGLKLPQFSNTAATSDSGAQSVQLVERDVEAPDAFQATDRGLWDGRPSLGGVWVAHPDVAEPERVIIRNQDNGKFVIGALFRKESETPGPKIQVSSDAAAALGMLAGAPASLNVTALRKEEQPADAVAAPAQAAETAEAVADAATAAPAAPTAVAQTPLTSSLSKPYIQIGIFSVESNATATADTLSRAGLPVRVIPGQSSGKPFWRVIAGPAQTTAERADLLAKVKAAGFADAYAVTD